MKIFLAGLLFFSATSAFANVSIECGDRFNENTGRMDQREFLIASEDGGEAKVYDANDQLIPEAKLAIAKDHSLILTITHAKTSMGPVGLKYTLEDYRGQNFIKAEKFIMGGYAGGLHRGTLVCSVSEL